jgi:hypothetical protein
VFCKTVSLFNLFSGNGPVWLKVTLKVRGILTSHPTAWAER